MTNPSDEPEAAPPQGGFLFNVNLVFLSTIVVYGLSFLMAVLLARTLGKDGRGITALFQAAVTLGFAFLSLGIATAAVYFVSRRQFSGRQAMETALTITLASLAITAAGVAVVGLAFADPLAEQDVPYWMALVAVPALVQFRALEAVLRGQGRFGAMNLIEITLPLTMLVFLGVTEIIWGLTVYRAIVAWSLACLPPVFIGYVMLGSRDWPRRLADANLLTPAVHFGVQGQAGNLIQLLNYRLDSYLVLWLVNAGGVGLYAVAVSFSEGLWFIANSVAVVLMTNLTAGEDEYAARMTPLVCRNTLLVTAAGAAAAAAVSPLLIPAVFGADFEDSVLPFVLLLPGTVALAGAKVLSAYIFSRGLPLINARIALISLIVTLLLDLALIPLFEVAGAAAGASLGYCLSLALSAAAYRRLSGAPIAEALAPRLADARLYLDGINSLSQRLLRGRREVEPRISENP
jgi:O-antigen/teichoic acid export membrane protein